jgi:preprotein translocase subunit SecE
LKSPGGFRICAAASDEGSMANPIQFIQQVRAEVAKVVWPTRREVGLTTLMVFLMATLAAIFFFIVDWLIRNGLTVVLSFFSG